MKNINECREYADLCEKRDEAVKANENNQTPFSLSEKLHIEGLVSGFASGWAFYWAAKGN